MLCPNYVYGPPSSLVIVSPWMYFETSKYYNKRSDPTFIDYFLQYTNMFAAKLQELGNHNTLICTVEIDNSCQPNPLQEKNSYLNILIKRNLILINQGYVTSHVSFTIINMSVVVFIY